MRPETKLQFDKACEALALDPSARDTAWRRISDLGLNPDDPTVIYLAVAGLLERASETLPAAINAMPAKVEEAARRAVGPVAKAAAAQVEAHHAKLTAETGKELAAVASAVFRERAVQNAYTVKFGLWVSALIAFALVLAVGFWIGNGVGRNDGLGAVVATRTWAQRPDFELVKRLLAFNPNLGRTVGSNCISGTPSQAVAGGARSCTMSVWLDTPPPAGVAAVGEPPYFVRSMTTFWMSGAEWLNRFHPLTILAQGIALGLLVPVLVRFGRTGRFRRA